MMQMANLIPTSTRETFWRTLQTFSVTRIVIGAVLLVYLAFNPYKGNEADAQFIRWETCAIYLGIAFGFAILSMRFRKRFLLQLLIQIAVDITAISLLYMATGGASSGLAILYLFPLAGGAILAPLVLALFFVSAVTLVLLMESGYQLLHTATETSLSRAGLICAAFFAAVFVINRLAARLIKQEDLAAQRGRELEVQEAINRLVIADMDDGVLVVDSDGSILAWNPAVERMLGLSAAYGQPGHKLTELPSLAPITDAFFKWAALSGDRLKSASAETAFVVVKPGDDILALQGSTVSRELRRELVAHLKLRFKNVGTAGVREDRAVIFLQDVAKIENQAQQLKLASMGRLTASIAHEVRNPLSAISHAASLLAEDITDPAQSRMLNIIADNVARLNRMIEDILGLSRKAQSAKEPLELAPFFAELLDEFRETHRLAPGMIEVGDMESYRVRFDPLHLREVVVNLLSNALRYASGVDASIRISLLLDSGGRLELHVQDDGPPIKPEVRAHLFEPFYTTSSKGTGLGLYLARELCLNNGAMLDYEYRLDAYNPKPVEPTGRFVITFAVAGATW
jgi:two-component system sensor histidine kinase PilS (NtrC family)